jgi:hypothetical protein
MPRLSKIGAAALAAFGWTGLQTVTADFLVVAGGGGAGGDLSGGGGAGGFRTSAGTSGGGASAESKLSLILTQSYTVTVGAGGAGNTSSGAGTNGSDSMFSTITSTGGGGGAGDGADANVGGSGGGGSSQKNPANGTANQGYAGGNRGGSAGSGSGGGGGAGAVGSNGSSSAGNGGNGGVGVASSISGTSTFYAGGGGGGGDSRTGGSTAGTGGNGGGGNGGRGTNGSAATANTGGGGGGGGQGGGDGAAGGSGIVIISYVGAQQFGGGVVTSSGGSTIHTFTTSGTLSPLSSLTASALVVAGGGGGGGTRAGGGGAGGFRTGSGITIDTNSIYAITVGSGGAGGDGAAAAAGSDGGNSVFLTITSTGGGGGAGANTGNGRTGGSGGGGCDNGTGGAGTSGQGNNGGNGQEVDGFTRSGGGGGGAGAVGSNGSGNTPGNGGNGSSSSISGTSVTYAGGGAGGSYSGSTAGVGGTGGGGNTIVAGTANRGGGGGAGTGNSASNYNGAAGGSGVVIISYPGSTQLMAGGTVTVSGGNVIHTFTSSGYLTPIVLVNNSLRFRSSASAYLNRTFGTPTNSTKWTWSGWFKLGYASTYYTIFDGGSPDTRFGRDPSTNQLYVNNDTTNFIITTPVYRDYSAWYHAVLAFDSSQGTASNRLRLYINGSEVTAFATDNRSSISGAIGINTATAHGIGRQPSGGSAYFDGYMADINFIDGQQLTPNSFGTSNGLGVWQPIRYGGSYGNNGFYLPFTNTTSTTTLGYDFSPQGNNWTTNNISLTAGSTYDSMTDVPTLTSATAANYAVLNPLAKDSDVTISNGNLNFDCTSAGLGGVIGTIAVSSGKWYWEVVTTNGIGGAAVGIAKLPLSAYDANQAGTYLYLTGGNKRLSPSTDSAYGASWTTNDVIGVALDMDAGTVTFYKNNTSQGTAFSSLSGDFTAWVQDGSNGADTVLNINFGQRPFAYTPPSGFNRLNTFNLPTPTIGATASTTANKYMNIALYTGTGSSQSITGLGFQPDWTWIKGRSGATDHGLYDAVRGVQKQLESNNNDAETTETTGLTAFGSDGFTVGALAQLNTSSATYVAWNWKANGAGSTNTAGSITSTVSANTSAGFSIVTYTGNGTSGATVGHGLGVAPSMVILKQRDGASNWQVKHVSLNANQNLVLNSTAAVDTAPGSGYISAISSTTLTLLNGGSAITNVNANNGTYVAYCFAPIAGYSAFGSYTGNGSSDGPFVFTGFRPAFVITKSSSAVSNWELEDYRRGYNGNISPLIPNDAGTEFSGDYVDLLSNGFKIRTSSTAWNSSGNTYIYMAFAENPFKFSNAR